MKKMFSLLPLLIVIAVSTAQTGRVGIGTTTPAIPFDVVGDTIGIRNSVSQWDNLWFHISGATANITASGADSGLRFRVGRNVSGNYGNNNQSFNTVMSLLPNGSIGIGTNIPTPFSQLSNTSKNTIGSDNNGGNSGSFSWATNLGGYAAQFFNGSTTGFSGGLAVKVLSNTGTVLDLSTGSQDSIGTSLLSVRSSGRVGIGTNLPFSQLSNTTKNTIGSDNNGGNPTSFSWVSNQGGYAAQIYNGSTTGYPNGLAVKVLNSNYTAFDVSTGPQDSVGTPLLTVKSYGNVGIGTSAPHAPLQFANTVVSRKIVFFESADNDHQFFGFGLSPTGVRYQVGNPSTSHVFYSGTGSGTSTELFRIAGTGRIGVGVSNPDYQLCNTTKNTIGADGNGGNTGSFSWVSNQGGYAAQIYNGSTVGLPNGLAVKVSGNTTNVSALDVSSGPQDTAGTSLFVVKANGSIGIGTRNPVGRVDVVAGAAPQVMRLAGGRGQDNNVGLLIIQDSSDNTSTTNSNILEAFINAQYGIIGGIVRTPNANSIGFASSSDTRLKTGIRPTHYGLNDLMAIEVADYVYKGYANPAPQTGFLAQQLYSIFPEAVIKGNDTDEKQPYLVDYGKLTPLLVKAVQELKAQVDALQKENEALKTASTSGLEARLKKLEVLMGNPDATNDHP